MKSLLILAAAIVLTGCGDNRTSLTLAGGKPVEFWLQALHSPDAKLRQKAVFKLGNVGSTEATPVAVLVNVLKDPDAGVRREAIVALLKREDDVQDAIPALVLAQSRDPDAKVRSIAGKAVSSLQRGG